MVSSLSFTSISEAVERAFTSPLLVSGVGAEETEDRVVATVDSARRCNSADRISSDARLFVRNNVSVEGPAADNRACTSELNDCTSADSMSE